MTPKQFLAQTLLLTLALFGLLFWLQSLPALQGMGSMTWYSLGLFFALTLAMYFLARPALADSSRFVPVFMGFVFGKMAISVLLIVLYVKLVQPPNRLFLLPFFLNYLAYTIFETAFLMKMARRNPPET